MKRATRSRSVQPGVFFDGQIVGTKWRHRTRQARTTANFSKHTIPMWTEWPLKKDVCNISVRTEYAQNFCMYDHLCGLKGPVGTDVLSPCGQKRV
jgi:hypothetical protein